ncbi:MAG: isocitrate/isopropylmalate dehydrogenase family protein [bacterium]|nr:isocitrate/isopropylmalate dehydrogenase family protein [bacterium]
MLKIAVIPGDGIGKEVVPCAVKVIDKVIDKIHFEWFDIGAERYLKTGELLTKKMINKLEEFNGILFGAIGSPKVPSGILEREILLKLRFHFDLYVNYRPIRTYKGLKNPIEKDFNYVIIRENTEGIYRAKGYYKNRVAYQGSISTYEKTKKLLDFAFKTAQKRSKKLIVVDKANVMVYEGKLWRDIAIALNKKKYKDINLSFCYVDAFSMYMVSKPEEFDVIAANNIFGDILSDLGAALSGGIGFVPSMNINPESKFGLFEPVHGSAPDIAGKKLANPIGSILSAALMLEFFGYLSEADKIFNAVESAIYDLPKEEAGFTDEVCNFIISKL